MPLICWIIFWSSGLVVCKNVFPSIRAGLIIPGYAENPTDAETLLRVRNASEVSNWEVAHADIAYGGNFGDAKLRDGLTSLGYMYIQALSFDPYDLEMSFKIRALDEGVDYEDFSMHYTQDTHYVLPDNSLALGSLTSLYGSPWLMGYTAGPTHSGFSVWQKPPYNLEPFSTASSGGYFYILQFERFDGFFFSLDNSSYDCGATSAIGLSGGSILEIEYVNATSSSNSRREASSWVPLQLQLDETNNLCRSGSMKFDPPQDWTAAVS